MLKIAGPMYKVQGVCSIDIGPKNMPYTQELMVTYLCANFMVIYYDKSVMLDTFT